MKKNIYIPPLPSSDNQLRLKISKTIERAGMQVISNNEPITDSLKSANQILCIITASLFEENNKALLGNIESINQYYELISQKPVFVWCPKDILNQLKTNGNHASIDKIKKLISNQHLVSYPSPIKLVDDLRNYKLKKTTPFPNKLYDITFISNENDKTKAQEAQLLINDIFKINPIYLNFSDQTDYSQQCAESILNSRGCVVFSKTTAEWAFYFAQQIWKIIGGVSANTPIIVVFDKKNQLPPTMKLDIPNLYTLTTEDRIAGLEIKILFEKIMNNASPDA